MLDYKGWPKTPEREKAEKEKAKDISLKLGMLPAEIHDGFLNRLLLTQEKYWGVIIYEEKERLQSIRDAEIKRKEAEGRVCWHN